MLPIVTPQLLGNRGLTALRDAARDPERWAIEPQVDGVRGLVTFDEGGRLTLTAAVVRALASGCAARRPRSPSV